MTVSVSNRLAVTLLALTGFMAVPFITSANNECGFSRTLDVEVEGEDVRCLQTFLNDRGYTISTSGGGAPGNETTQFGSLTEAAVIRWQEVKGISPATGVFGPQSQAAYLLDMAIELETELAKKEAALVSVDQAATTAASPQPQVAGVSVISISTQFVTALEKIEIADDEVEHLVITSQSYKDELRDLNKAKRIFMNAAMAYFTGDQTKAAAILTGVEDYTDSVAGNDSSKAKNTKDDEEDEKDKDDDKNYDKDELSDDIEKEWKDYDKVLKDYKELSDNSSVRGKVKDMLKDASKYLTRAEDALSDKDYEDISGLLKKADKELDEARTLTN